MDARDWEDLASVYRAGAHRARGWVMNLDRQQDADILDAQADRCEEIARERKGWPAVTHTHYHEDVDGTRHRHEHSHPSGNNTHDPGLMMTGAGGRLVPAHVHPKPGPLWPGP